MTKRAEPERRNRFVYEGFTGPDHVRSHIAKRGKPKIWREGLGDITQDGHYKVWSADNSWSCEVEVRNGHVTKVL